MDGTYDIVREGRDFPDDSGHVRALEMGGLFAKVALDLR